MQNSHHLIYPLTPERWNDFENLFGEHGGYGGCWCMYWRMKRNEFMKVPAEMRKAAMHTLVDSGIVPGLLLYDGNEPIGWCSIGPQEDFSPLEHSRTIKRIDDQPVWSIVCFFIVKKHRKQGVMTDLIKGAVAYSLSHGAKIIEAYPTDMQSDDLVGKKLTGYHGFMGIASAFRRVGFIEVGRVYEYQPIMRYTINE